MPGSTPPFSTLRRQIEPEIADAIEHLVGEAADAALNRINPLAFAAARGLSETATIAGFLHATRSGIFEMSWNVVCGLCGGVLHAGQSLKSIDRRHYSCALCSADCEPDLGESVEVSFTLAPNVRRIAAHDPGRLELWDYARQIYWSSGSDLAAGHGPVVDEAVLDAADLPPGGRALRNLDFPEGHAVMFDPVTHRSQLIAVSGQRASEPQALTIVLDDGPGSDAPLTIAPGPVSIELENRTGQRVLPILFKVDQSLQRLVGQRIPVLTASRLLTHQTFRDLFRTDVLNIHQRFSIRNLTFMFTDLKGSTALYERVGDLAAFDLVSAHFDTLTDIIAEQSGAVVKTIGDAVMATFPTPAHAIAAALKAREAMQALNDRNGHQDLLIKIGLHAGSCLAVMLNDRQDYFGQTVNIAARVQGLASVDAILATPEVAEEPSALALIDAQGLALRHIRSTLRGIGREIDICEIA